VNDLKNKEVDLPSAKEAYNAAWATLQQGHEEIAITEFRDFLTRFPNDPVWTPAAQLQIGNAYAAMGKFEQSDVEYDLTIDKWPTSEAKCTALYKKGQTLVQRKPSELPKAAAAFNRVVKECANATEAPFASAEFAKLPAAAKRGLQ
jgi:TolA-binding protein